MTRRHTSLARRAATIGLLLLAGAVALTSAAAWWQFRSEISRSIEIRSEIGLRIAARTMSTLSSSYSPVYDDAGIVIRVEADKIRERLNGTVVDQVSRTSNMPAFLLTSDPHARTLTRVAGASPAGSSLDELAVPAGGPAWLAVAAGRAYKGIEQTGAGQHYIGVLPITAADQSPLGAVVIDLGSVSDVEAGIRTLGWKLLASSTIVLLIGGISGAWFIGRSITRPVRAMTAAMSALAAGDLSVAVPEALRTDEIGAMAKAVQVFKDNAAEMATLRRNQETASLRAAAERQAAMQRMADTFESAVKDLIADVAGSAGDMESTARSLLITAREGSSQARTVAAATEQTSANVQTVASAVEELSTSIDAITQEVAEAAKISLTASDYIAKNAHQVADGTREVSDHIGRVTEAAARTGTAAEQVLGSAGRVSRNADRLRDEVEAFLATVRTG